MWTFTRMLKSTTSVKKNIESTWGSSHFLLAGRNLLGCQNFWRFPKVYLIIPHMTGQLFIPKKSPKQPGSFFYIAKCCRLPQRIVARSLTVPSLTLGLRIRRLASVEGVELPVLKPADMNPRGGMNFQGIVGCTPIPTWAPYGKSPKNGLFLVGIYGLKIPKNP